MMNYSATSSILFPNPQHRKVYREIFCNALEENPVIFHSMWAKRVWNAKLLYKIIQHTGYIRWKQKNTLLFFPTRKTIKFRNTKHTFFLIFRIIIGFIVWIFPHYILLDEVTLNELFFKYRRVICNRDYKCIVKINEVWCWW